MVKTKLINMKRIIYAVLGCVCFTSSCDTTLDIEEAPHLEVTTAKTTYKVGEEVIFNIQGDPRILNFFSGEFGNDYDYIGGRIIPPGQTLFSFDLRYQTPANEGATISVLASTDFSGDRNSFEDVDAATWTDITDRCHINYTSNGRANSGKVDVSDLMIEGLPMYFAFKYVFDPEVGTPGAIVWIWDVVVESTTILGTTVLSGNSESDFLIYPAATAEKHPVHSQNRARMADQSSDAIIMRQNPNTREHEGVTYNRNDYTEEYFVSVPYNVSDNLNPGPDKPETLKGYTDSRVDSHVHVFSEPGVYKVRFVGIDHSIKESKETIRELEITILGDEEDDDE